MDALDRIKIEHDCTALCHSFGYFLDKRDYDSVAALFTGDGVWKRYGIDLRGHKALVAAMKQRSLTQLTRHLITNIHFTEVSDNICRAIATTVVFYNSNAIAIPALLPPDSIVVMDFHDIFTRDEAGWRFRERDTLPILLSETMFAALAGSH